MAKTNKTAGFMVQYTKENGLVQRGIVRHAEQDPEIIRKQKVKVRLISDNFLPMLDENKLEVIVLKDKALVKIIGYVD